jgi:hypothetical protein
MADYKILDVESEFVSSILTAVVGLGMPTVRFGISFKSQKNGTRYSLHQRNGASTPAASHRTTQSKDPDHRKPTRRPQMPGSSRWSARNLKQNRRRLKGLRDKARASPLGSHMQHVPAAARSVVRTLLRCNMHDQKERERARRVAGGQTTTPRWRSRSRLRQHCIDGLLRHALYWGGGEVTITPSWLNVRVGSQDRVPNCPAKFNLCK